LDQRGIAPADLATPIVPDNDLHHELWVARRFI
jgi:hypothetical protein